MRTCTTCNGDETGCDHCGSTGKLDPEVCKQNRCCHSLVSLEVSDGILARIVHARCSCGWSGGTFLSDDDSVKLVKAHMRKRFADHASGRGPTKRVG